MSKVGARWVEMLRGGVPGDLLKPRWQEVRGSREREGFAARFSYLIGSQEACDSGDRAGHLDITGFVV